MLSTIVPNTTNYYSFNEFDNVGELRLWLALDDTNNQEYDNKTFDCEDFSMMLVDHAREDGYKVYTYAVGTHMKCITKISDNFYAIEPQNDNILNMGSEI